MRQNDLARLGTIAIELKMPRRTEIADYEPVTRSQTPRASETEPEDTSIGSRMRPDLNLRNVVTATDEQGWRSKNSTGKAVPLQEGIPRKQKESPPSRLKENWIIKRGHALSYAGVFLFTIVLFFRPYELFPSLSFLSTSAFWLGVLTLSVFIPTQLALEGALTARPSEVNLVMLLCVLALLSIPLAISPAEAWFTFNDTFIKAVLIFIVIVNAARTERRLNGLLFLSMAVAFVLSVAAINDYRAGNFATQGIRIKGIIGGIFGNPNDLAIHLVTMFPLAIGLLLGARNVFKKALYALCAVVFVAATVATDSRGAFLALVGSGAVLTWKLGRGRRFMSITLALVLAAAFIGLSPASYADRVLSIFGMGSDPIGAASGEARKNLLKHSFYTAIRSPFGVGMGNYHIVAVHEAVSHNSYTQVASELGLIALVVYVMFLVSPFKKLRRVERGAFGVGESKRFYYLAIGLQASLVAYMISSFFGSVAYQWYVYYLVGYSVILHRLYVATVGLQGSAIDGPAGGLKPSAATKVRAQEVEPQTAI